MTKDQPDGVSPLVEFFRGEGYSAFGFDGDSRGWTPERTAIEAMRELMRLRAAPQPTDADMVYFRQAHGDDSIGRTAHQQSSPQPSGVQMWKPYLIRGRWPYYQCATPHGPYTFHAESQEAAEAHCAKEQAADQQSLTPADLERRAPLMASVVADAARAADQQAAAPCKNCGGTGESPVGSGFVCGVCNGTADPPR